MRQLGKAGGKARSAALTPARRKEIASVAAKVRWSAARVLSRPEPS